MAYTKSTGTMGALWFAMKYECALALKVGWFRLTAAAEPGWNKEELAILPVSVEEIVNDHAKADSFRSTRCCRRARRGILDPSDFALLTLFFSGHRHSFKTACGF